MFPSLCACRLLRGRISRNTEGSRREHHVRTRRHVSSTTTEHRRAAEELSVPAVPQRWVHCSTSTAIAFHDHAQFHRHGASHLQRRCSGEGKETEGIGLHSVLSGRWFFTLMLWIRDVREWFSCTHSLPFPWLCSHSHSRPWEISCFTAPIYSQKAIPIPSHSHFHWNPKSFKKSYSSERKINKHQKIFTIIAY